MRRLLTRIFCVDCLTRGCCDHAGSSRAMPIVPAAVTLVIRHYSEHLEGYHGLPWPGGFRGQPEWFNDLTDCVRSEHANIIAEEQQRNNNGKASNRHRPLDR